ncbi:YncE family protein [Rhizobium sp. SL86]|uniref:YncE family protein n=1 Tax=Rhizobium sp. SL86 TaxID=2995148 RepID=UPI0022760882|nr:YncE family protein [Rhizobium sp. SL86]MCY1668682.1 YncE family protein [Rhizobium sp. SL86]
MKQQTTSTAALPFKIGLSRLALIAGTMALGLTGAHAQSAFDTLDKDYKGQVRVSAAQRGQPLNAGGEVAVQGQNFKPGQKVQLLRGTTALSDFTADAEGKIQGKFSLPADAVVGTHPLIVTTESPYFADVVKLKISPKVPLSGEDKFAMKSEKPGSGLYQVAFSKKNNALFVTASSGRPPVKNSELIKLDPQTLSTIAKVTPAEAPAQGERGGGVFAVYGIGVDDANDTVWVTNTRQNTVAVYKQSDLSLVKQFAPGAAEHARDVKVDEKNGKAYVSQVGVPEVAVFDTKTLEKLASIQIQSKVRGERFSPASMDFDPASGKLFVVSLSSNEVAVIDSVAGKVESVFPVKGGLSTIGVAYDAADNRIFVAGQGSDDLLILDAKTGDLLHDVAVGAGALNVTFEPVSKTAYVSARDAGTVTVVDADGKIVANLSVAPFANHVVSDGKGGVYAVNKSLNPEDDKGDRVTLITPAK